MFFPECTSREYHVKNISCDRMSLIECVGLVNLADSLDHIYDIRCQSYLNSMSDIVYKKNIKF